MTEIMRFLTALLLSPLLLAHYVEEVCPVNEKWITCSDPCERSCANPKPDCKKCTLIQKGVFRKCGCIDGYVRDSGHCIPESACGKEQCVGENEEFRRCGTECEATCREPRPKCNKRCVRDQCECKDGFVRDWRNECIHQSRCPAGSGDDDDDQNEEDDLDDSLHCPPRSVGHYKVIIIALVLLVICLAGRLYQVSARLLRTTGICPEEMALGDKVSVEESSMLTESVRSDIVEEEVLEEAESLLSLIEKVEFMSETATEPEEQVVAAVKELLVDFHAANASIMIESMMQNSVGEMSDAVKNMADEIASFYEEFALLLASKEAKDICQLRNSIDEIEMRRVIEKLRKKYGAEKPAEQVNVALEDGKRLRHKFDQIEKMKNKIAKLRQSVISEIRSYASPPDGVHQVMMATYLLLGQREHDIQSWKEMKALLGKNGPLSLKRRIQGHDQKNVEAETVSRAEELLEAVDLAEVEKLSEGAAIFYSWCQVTIQARRA